VHPSFPSQFLDARDLLVYLPPGYEADGERRYPVLYMQDGQNLFGDAASPFSGQGWDLDRTATRLILAGAIEPLIIVGIPNAGERRGDEYTPTHDAERAVGGRGDQYGRMLVEEVKPFVDRAYQTHPGPETTALGGSSHGALIALHLGLTYPHVFGKLALLSTSVWWDQQVILRAVQALPSKLPLRIWLDVGTEERPDTVQGARLLRDALIARGWSLGRDLDYFEALGAGHDEGAWAARCDRFLTFLFPPA
jgi:predicted alpha/beta superfamily hydrolase